MSGSALAGDLWDEIQGLVPEHNKLLVANKIIEVFEAHDCDTLQDVETLWRAAGRYAAFDAGRLAKSLGKEASENPYREDTEEYQEWLGGHGGDLS